MERRRGHNRRSVRGDLCRRTDHYLDHWGGAEKEAIAEKGLGGRKKEESEQSRSPERGEGTYYVFWGPMGGGKGAGEKTKKGRGEKGWHKQTNSAKNEELSVERHVCRRKKTERPVVRKVLLLRKNRGVSLTIGFSKTA